MFSLARVQNMLRRSEIIRVPCGMNISKIACTLLLFRYCTGIVCTSILIQTYSALYQSLGGIIHDCTYTCIQPFSRTICISSTAQKRPFSLLSFCPTAPPFFSQISILLSTTPLANHLPIPPVHLTQRSLNMSKYLPHQLGHGP